MKKIISLILVFAFLITLGVAASAATPPSIDLLWDNIDNIDYGLYINGERSCAYSDIFAKPGTVSIEATLTVYRLMGTHWMFIADTTKTVYENDMYIEVGFTSIPNSSYKSILVVHVTNSEGYTESFQRAEYANS